MPPRHTYTQGALLLSPFSLLTDPKERRIVLPNFMTEPLLALPV